MIILVKPKLEDESTFLNLPDTPTTYSGFENYLVTVNSSANSIVFTSHSGVAGQLDHGYLQGILDDDHTQYILADGSRDFTEIVNYDSHPTFSGNTDIIDKKYVDDKFATQSGTFVDLEDTPDAFDGYGGRFLRVKSDETALEFDTWQEMFPPSFYTPPSGTAVNFNFSGSYSAPDYDEVDFIFGVYFDSDLLSGDKVFVNSTGRDFALMLPPNPSIGDSISIIDGGGYCATNNVTVSGSGKKIMGSYDDYIVNEDFYSLDLVYYDELNGWIVREYSTSAISTFLDLSDTPSGYYSEKFVKSTTSGLEWSYITESDVVGLDKYTQAEVNTISGSLQTAIDGKADSSHIHDDRYYTEIEMDALLASVSGTMDHTELSNIGTNTHSGIDTHIADAGKHREIDDGGFGATDLWSAEQIEARVVTATGTLTTDHGELEGLTDDDHTLYIKHDGTRALTGTWAVGNQQITGVQHLDLNATSSEIRMNASPVFRIIDNNFFAGLNVGLNQTVGAYNVGLGYDAFGALTGGDRNVGIGYHVGGLLEGGSRNVLIGYYAGDSLVENNDTVFIGFLAGHIATTGAQVLIGSEAGAALTSGEGNVAVGFQAMPEVVTNSYNVAVGHQALYATTGEENVAIGALAGYDAKLNYNTLIGSYAGYSLGNGVECVVIGYKAGLIVDHADPHGAVAIGYQAGYGNLGDYDVIIGHNACEIGMDDLGRNVLIGGEVCQSLADGKNNVIIGFRAARNATDSIDGSVLIGVNVARTSGGLLNILMIDRQDTTEPLIYGEFTSGTRANGLLRTYGTLEAHTKRNIDVDNGEVWDTGIDRYHGLVIVTIVSDDLSCIFHIEDNVVYEVSDPSLIFGTAAGAEQYNVYYSGDNLVVQNDSGINNKDILVSLIGGIAT